MCTISFNVKSCFWLRYRETLSSLSTDSAIELYIQLAGIRKLINMLHRGI
jgi:hypothetical protein